jgi:hypothetical protein
MAIRATGRVSVFRTSGSSPPPPRGPRGTFSFRFDFLFPARAGYGRGGCCFVGEPQRRRMSHAVPCSKRPCMGADFLPRGHAQWVVRV